MANTNPVMQVLVTSGNQHPLAAGSRVDALKNGQIGVFDAHTGLSVDEDGAANLKEVFIAVGINRTSGGTANAEDIAVSAGQTIKAKLVKGYTFKGYTAGQNKIIKVSGFTVAEGDECAIKLEIRNQAVYMEAGFNGFFKTFTSVKETVEEVVADLVAQINENSEDLWVATATDTNTSITIEFKPFTEHKFSNDINLRYLNTNGSDALVSLPSGFTGATVTTTQELKYPEGRAYDVKQLEYVAGGWNGKPGPYRQSTSTGMPRNGFEYFAVDNATYNLFTLTYEGPQEAAGGWEGTTETIIAIPCADTLTLVGDAGVTSTGIVGILDAALAAIGALADDVAANGDCTNVATNLLTPATDGIETVS